MILKIFLVVLFNTLLIFPQKSPKNIIILIGDGMGLNYVTASIFKDPENAFQKFTTVGLSITSSADQLITDSGASATAISTGYRTYNLAIGMDTLRRPLTNLMQIAKSLNKSTGIVATSSVTHATPAAFVSHVPERKMEIEIAKQMISSGTDVVIGGGREFFTSSENLGKRVQGDDLLDSIRLKGFNLYSSIEELRASNTQKPFYALLEMGALKPAGEREYDLKELVSAAIKHLSRKNNGFVLMVEGSQIDWAAHDNKTEQLLKEMKDFSDAVNVALEFASNNENTLVLVTTDHETGGGAITKGNLDGTNLELKYTSTGHTPVLVGIFAKGKGEKEFGGIMRINEIGRKLIRLLQPDYTFH
jgi:alkaline phosphatase